MSKTGQRRKQIRKLRRAERRELLRNVSQEGVRSAATRDARDARDKSQSPSQSPSTLVDTDLCYRASAIGTINESERTIIATLTTEQPVAMYDYRTGKGMIDEVLVAGGGRMAEKLPLLDDHSRWGSTSVIGSIRGMSRDGDRWRGTLHFARNVGPQADQIWELVRQGHLTDVSIGYRYGNEDFVDISSGRSAVIEGKEYKAGARTLRVVTNWTAREVSTTPIGADDQAKIGRGETSFGGTPATNAANSNGTSTGIGQPGSQENSNGARNGAENKMKFLQWLQARGMSMEITEQAAALAWAKRNLAGDLLVEFAEVCRAENIQFEASVTTTSTQQASGNVTASSATSTEPTRTTTTSDQYRAETDRVGYIRQMAETLGVGQDLVRQAITERWDVARVNEQFAAPANRQERSEPLTPAIHTRQSGLNLRTLQAAMLLRAGVEIDNPMLRSQQASHVLNSREAFGARADGQPIQNAAWISNYSRSLEAGGATTDDESARAVEAAWAYRSMSLVDVCRAAMDIEGQRYNGYDREEIVQRAFSTATLNAVFTTNFAAQMLEGFMTAPDTTGPWTREADLPNFQTVERIQKHLLSGLKRTDRNQTPEDAESAAVLESYKLARYTERFTVDEMDIIDDRFGALDMTPGEMGEAARELRPDLVYSILLGNPTMGQDNVALFHAASHKNLVASGAGLSVDTLAARKSAMAQQTSNGRLLNIMARFLIVPESKHWEARTIIGSSELRNNTSDVKYGTMNPAAGSFQVVAEPRLDVGVTDPSTLPKPTTHAGQPGAWFLATANGRHGIEVGHLRGTGRAPVVRRYNLTEGRIGMGWLVIMYCAAKAIGYQGLQKAAA